MANLGETRTLCGPVPTALEAVGTTSRVGRMIRSLTPGLWKYWVVLAAGAVVIRQFSRSGRDSPVYEMFELTVNLAGFV